MISPLQIVVVLITWAIPIAILVWFVRAVNAIRDSLRRIELRLKVLDPG